MLVKEVRKINDRKRKVLFEDGFSFVLYSAEIHRFQIRSGEDVPEEVIRQICEEILKKLRPDGLLNADLDVLKLMDHSLAPGVASTVIPVKLNKSPNKETGSFLGAGSRTADITDFQSYKQM